MTDTPVMDIAAREEARALSLRGGRPPAPVPGYERAAYLGRGAYGEVWVATDSNSGRKVAIKFYTRRGGTDWAALAREVEKLRYLFNSRHVVQLLRVGWDSDPPYYVMEYLENGSLEDLLRAGPLPVGAAVGMFRDIAVGLVHAHGKGVLHCDLKPGNILLDHDRRPRLADFGQARLAHEVAPALGTLFYMAPEQADLTATPDARWDVYALGAVLYRMLTGAPPHRDDPHSGTLPASGALGDQLAAYRTMIRSGPPPAAHRAVPGVDAGLAAVVDKCLAADPARRYPNPQAVVTALDAWRLGRVRRPMLAVTALGFVALLVVIGGLGAYLFRDAVSTATGELVRRALDGNRFAAKSAAERLGLQVQYRWQVLETEARDPRLRGWLAGPKADALGDPLDAWLAKRKAKYDPQLDENGPSGIWFADARDGLQYGTAPPYPQHRFRYRGYRDYFHGLGRDLPDQTGPPPGVITAPHRSIAFRRQVKHADEFWTVAFSVPVWAHGEPGGDPVGIIGLTYDLRGQTRIEGDRERFAVLIDTRPDAAGRRGLLLRHPFLEQPHESEGKDEPPLRHADRVVRWADGGEAESAWADYADPAGGAFAGEWLAAAERVRVNGEGGVAADTGLVVLVQERRAEVLKPVAELRGRLGVGAAVAGLVVLATVLAMWAGMVSVVDGSSRSGVTRLLRRLAGLPAGTGTGTGTAPTGETGG